MSLALQKDSKIHNSMKNLAAAEIFIEDLSLHGCIGGAFHH